jgi:hypothetical protein
VIARLLLWNLGDSKTSLDELRTQLPTLETGTWLANEAAERFGLVVYGEALPDVAAIEELIGRPADAAEEFDVLEP